MWQTAPAPLPPLLKVTLHTPQVSLWIQTGFPVLPLGDTDGGRPTGADSHAIAFEESQQVSHERDLVHGC